MFLNGYYTRQNKDFDLISYIHFLYFMLMNELSGKRLIRLLSKPV